MMTFMLSIIHDLLTTTSNQDTFLQISCFIFQYNLLLYITKEQQLTNAKIHAGFTLTVRL